jgi:hypothetical protein
MTIKVDYRPNRPTVVKPRAEEPAGFKVDYRVPR